jgi:hypothetical protein
MTIRLTPALVARALDSLDEGHGLESYLWIQSEVKRSGDFYRNEAFRRRFNRFYRVRRAAPWRDTFYSVMGRALRERLRFPAVLGLLYEATSRYEASFASKLVATLDPSKPVIDSVVLKNLGLRLPAAHAPDRSQRICQVYDQLAVCLSDFLSTDGGAHLVSAFQRRFPDARITEVKMLDLVLWQTRS